MTIRSNSLTKHLVLYGLSLAVLLFLLRWLEVRYLLLTHAVDVYIGAIALIFTSLGIWLALKLVAPKKETIVVEKQVFVEVPAAPLQAGGTFSINNKALDTYDLSTRELEVLQLMAKGLSNQEIADQMFVSLNTIKTHSSNLFMKLDVKRRTQAVDKARNIGLIQ
jgi:two-component system, NarL family, response regulator LiaR